MIVYCTLYIFIDFLLPFIAEVGPYKIHFYWFNNIVNIFKKASMI